MDISLLSKHISSCSLLLLFRHGLLFDITMFLRLTPLLSGGVYMIELISNFKWIIPNDLADFDPTLVTRIQEVVIPYFSAEDRLIWKASTDGYFTAKQAYQLMFPAVAVSAWSFHWHNYVPPSHSFVVWRCLHDQMPTDENLQRRGCTVVSVCVLCMQQSETTAHLFLLCPFAQELWNWLGDLFNVHFDITSFLSLFDSCVPSWSSQLRHITLAAIIHTFHKIWMARNLIRFNSASIILQAAKMKIRTTIATSSSSAGGHTSGSMEEKAVLQRRHVPPRLMNAPAIMMVLWQTPIFSWVKANTDGSLINNSAACGALFRDHTANFLGGFTSKLSFKSVLHAELMSIIFAMDLAHNKGWSKLWIESDSQVALGAFKDIEVVPWNLRNRWGNCLSLDLNIYYSHIYREGNTCADKLASLVHSGQHFTWFNNIPVCIKDEFFKG
ncbi:unnamed protein product [Trifolium pratense]|uniref:Uncharacterized protein n=1 Tax=Trifolium pratense TaxID=57577 RepID=A0ACB0K9Z6_TRIPR|nr:unnamed protein product [Trifolium pratense]